MKRRTFLQVGLGIAMGKRLLADEDRDDIDIAAQALGEFVSSGQVRAASLLVQQGDSLFARSFGDAQSTDDVFLLASISKPISAAAIMTLFDQQQFGLDDPVKRFIPEFKGDGRDAITMRQLLTHVSGLPDQLPNNVELRSRHAELSEFVEAAIQTPLLFAPGSRYGYSSMAILLAAEVAQRISQTAFPLFVDETIYRPLGMRHSALGLGKLDFETLMPCQVERAAVESGGGDAATKSWDWNSRYWRQLGAPWGGAHGSAADVARFLAEFLRPSGKTLRPETARSMITNNNPSGVRARGLGFDLGARAASPGCSDRTFGHGGSTGTLCWADPATDTTCIVLTTLPLRAASPHPRNVTSDLVARAMNHRR